MKRRKPAPWLQAVIGWGVLVTVLLFSLAWGANRPVSWISMSVIIAALFAGQVAYGFFSNAPMQIRKMTLPASLYCIVLIWAFLQLLPIAPDALAHPIWGVAPNADASMSVDPGQGRLMLMRLIAYPMVFWIIVWSAVSRDRATLFLKAIALWSTALATFGLYAWWTGENAILGEDFTSPTVVQSSFINRNNYATYAVFGALANIATYLHATSNAPVGRDWQSKLRNALENFYGGAWMYGIGAIICIAAISLTQSRAGAAAGVIGLVVLVASWRGGGRRWDPWLMLSLSAIVVFVAMTSATGLTKRLLAADTAEEGRFLVYPRILEGIFDRPIFGHGIGSFHDAFRTYTPLEAAFGEWVRAHSSYLENGFELGLPAATLFYIAISLVGWRLHKGSVERRRDRSFACCALACLAAAAFHSVFDFSLQMPATAALFSAILGIGWAQSFTHKESHA
ncbi:MAG: O-antigen ligase family protein [Pseudomonadota bacterium]